MGRMKTMKRRRRRLYRYLNHSESADSTTGALNTHCIRSQELLKQTPSAATVFVRCRMTFQPHVDDESMSFQNNVNRDQFVQDPALLRERAEARRAAMQQRKG